MHARPEAPQHFHRNIAFKSSELRQDFEDSDQDDALSSSSWSSSDSSTDEEEMNKRLKPFWPNYQCLFHQQGLRLDTVRDAKNMYCSRLNSPYCPGQSAWNQDDDALYHDPSLQDHLFRGTRVQDGRRFVVKAVHASSREFEVFSILSRPPLRDDPMNHTIPVLGLFESGRDQIAFIVMEEWTSQVATQPDILCCRRQFMSALGCFIEHIAFMHKHGLAHLDVSLRNVLTDSRGHYAYVDYEISRQFPLSLQSPSVYGHRATEVPPECEKCGWVDPFKVDVWALGVLVLRACKLSGHWVPELMDVIIPMLSEEPWQRPSASCVLQTFNKLVVSLGDQIGPECLNFGPVS